MRRNASHMLVVSPKSLNCRAESRSSHWPCVQLSLLQSVFWHRCSLSLPHGIERTLAVIYKPPALFRSSATLSSPFVCFFNSTSTSVSRGIKDSTLCFSTCQNTRSKRERIYYILSITNGERHEYDKPSTQPPA